MRQAASIKIARENESAAKNFERRDRSGRHQRTQIQEEARSRTTTSSCPGVYQCHEEGEMNPKSAITLMVPGGFDARAMLPKRLYNYADHASWLVSKVTMGS